jgi:serine phosphatase RsbU (regulator of sigma subunit)
MANKSRILIVEDNETDRKLLYDMMITLGHKPILAENGLTALSMIKKEPPDLVLLDILMPEMDAYEVLDRMEEDKSMHHIPVIMITAINEIESAARCIAKGADDYLIKPFNPTLLKARIIGSLEKKRLHDKNIELLNKVLAQQKQMEMELKIAEKVQKAMLPVKERVEQNGNYRIETYYQATSSIGGDFYHYAKYGENKVSFLLADVSGHGPAAALIVAAIKSIIESESQNHLPPAKLMQSLNEKLFTMIPEDHFATMFFCIANFAAGNLAYTSAAHPPGFVFGERLDEPIPLKTNGGMVGIFENETFGEDKVSFTKGDKLIIYSDGVHETRGKNGDMYGLERLVKLIQNCRKAPVKEILAELVKEVGNFWDGKSARDDMAVVIVEFI